ncbi:vWA domain-containing protein [Pseudonocardia humida]|uniref:VWA domain-containing protein n=1 Tax=Pseudonocardia humida TaxID=2800819 RepID=A0ABT0ZVK1_9PSEU|nr:VWA domain-containing protein [Pseudonocardia humida]MCO1654774.1 VWA domain-containing protein [Pseudonocardia humida]
MGADLPGVAAGFVDRCRAAGLPVGPDGAQRFAGAVVAVAPGTAARLLSCARATLVSDPAQLPLLDAVFAEVFGGLTDDVRRGDPTAPPTEDGKPDDGAGPGRRVGGAAGGGAPRGAPGGRGKGPAREVGMPVAASGAERLADRDFDALGPDELALLAVAMRRFRLATPPRRSRRTRRAAHGQHVDLRRTLRAARRTGGDPVRLARRARRSVPRRLVVLCDISGSMEPWARALLQLLYCATGAQRAEVFTFATRLTRLTRVMARTSPAVALERAARLAPDWSGGTRIGEALGRFLDLHGGGMARGAVVLVVSDGWETGDPAELARQMARLRRRAHRIVWANPRTRHAGYRPLVGGMAAAWPYCDAVVSAHRLDALDELVAALRGAGRDSRPAG